MDGIHDLGGMDGFGAVAREADEPVFHAEWERRLFALALAAGLVATGLCTESSGAENPYAPDTPEPGSVEAIAHFTTEPRFLSPWVAYVPASATVPSPTKGSATSGR